MYLAAKEILPPDDRIYLIEEGVVRTGFRHGFDGNVKITGLYGANHLISYEMLQSEDFFIGAMTDCKLARVKINSSIDSGYFLTRVRHDFSFSQATTTGELRQKVYKTLLWIGVKFGTKHDYGLEIPFHVSQQCLGEILNTWRTSITSRLRFLEKQEAIIINKRRIIVNDKIDIEKLKKEREGE